MNKDEPVIYNVKDHAYLNNHARIECNGVEFASGDVVVVRLAGVWKETRIEYDDDRGYYSIDNYQLLGNPIKLK